MLKRWIKNIIVHFKLLFIGEKIENRDLRSTYNKDKANSSNSNTSILPSTTSNSVIGGVEQEAKMFQRKNDLINEGDWGHGPIVYEADMITIRKESQYGYNDKEDNYEEELLADDVDLMWNIDKSHIKRREESNTASYLEGKKVAFDERWEDIKRQVREDDDVDGVIKED